MKVLLLNGSSHPNGTTMAAIKEMEKVFHAENVETEVIQVGGKPIADCLQCNVCQKTGKCVFKDDGVNDFVEKAKSADGFVLQHRCILHIPVEGFMISWTVRFTVRGVMKFMMLLNSNREQLWLLQEEAERPRRWMV